MATDRDPTLPSLADAAWLVRPATQAVFRAIAAAGHEARVVGGAVRNALLHLPVVDVDMATTARPADVVRACEDAGLKCVPTGIAHGTVTVIADRVPFEVTTLREDVETFGRRATVSFTTQWEADARRRDFTMNALYCTADGTVLDPLHGYRDVARRRVRFIGDARLRIREDYLRILRFFRFHAEYGDGVPDSAGLEACVRERAGLAGLSAERMRSEVVRLLVAPGAADTIRRMCDFGLLTAILGVAPRPTLLENLAACEQASGAEPDAMLRLSALAVAVEEDAGRLAARLRLSTAEREKLVVVDRHLARLGNLDPQAARRSLYAAGAEIWRARVLAAAAASGGATGGVWRRLYDLPATWLVPAYPLRGNDAVQLGVAAGPEVGRVLREVETWWIEGDFAADEAALRARLTALVRDRPGKASGRLSPTRDRR